MLSRLRVFKETGKKVIVAGCMASVQDELIYSILPDALLLPPQYSHHVNDLLSSRDVSFIEKNKTESKRTRKWKEILTNDSLPEVWKIWSSN